MFRRGFIIFRILTAFLFVAVLIGAGFMVFRAGQAQGYALGAAASNGAQVAPQPALPAYPMYPRAWPGYYGMHFFPFGPLFGLLLCGGMIFFFFFVVGGMFRFRPAYLP